MTGVVNTAVEEWLIALITKSGWTIKLTDLLNSHFEVSNSKTAEWQFPDHQLIECLLKPAIHFQPQSAAPPHWDEFHPGD